MITSQLGSLQHVLAVNWAESGGQDHMAATGMAPPLCFLRTCLPIVSIWLLIGRASPRAPALSWMMRAPKAPAEDMEPLNSDLALIKCPGVAMKIYNGNVDKSQQRPTVNAAVIHRGSSIASSSPVAFQTSSVKELASQCQVSVSRLMPAATVAQGYKA